MRSLLIVAALLSLAAAFTAQEYQDAFASWMQQNGKVYATDEFQTRFSVFQSNMDYVNEWNSKNSLTVLGLTRFADLTNAEYRATYLGTRFDGTERLRNAPKIAVPRPQANDTVNWTNKGAVTPIKDQGQCGSCWSFSTTGSVEGIHFLSTGNLVSLSEQNLMDCSGKYGNQGCNGGLMDDAFQYIINNKGIDTEASYPYTMASEACNYTSANSGATISAYNDVTSGSEDALASAVNNQPISVAIDAGHQSFQLYKTGVYSEPACSAVRLDHGVLAVGYGTANGVDYWLVKNSCEEKETRRYESRFSETKKKINT